MVDISGALQMIMAKRKCSSVYALYLLGGEYDEPDDEPAISVHKPIHTKDTDAKQHKLGSGD